MKRRETYLSRDFRETVALRFPAQAKELNAAFDMRLSALLAENADASKEKQYHLKRQILPGIAAYETLQRVLALTEKLLGEDYNQIAKSMSDGLDFFCPGFEGTREEGLRLILDRQLSPFVLGRSVFCESKLAYAIANGCKQYPVYD